MGSGPQETLPDQGIRKYPFVLLRVRPCFKGGGVGGGRGSCPRMDIHRSGQEWNTRATAADLRGPVALFVMTSFGSHRHPFCALCVASPLQPMIAHAQASQPPRRPDLWTSSRREACLGEDHNPATPSNYVVQVLTSHTQFPSCEVHDVIQVVT